jgi:hypothetical protein
MKKLFAFLLVALFAASTVVSAKAPVAKTDKKGVKQEVKKEEKAVKETADKKAGEASATGQKLKKDGTPDMRFKENKDAAKTEVKHLKKDGTPDMRFKENKAEVKK